MPFAGFRILGSAASVAVALALTAPAWAEPGVEEEPKAASTAGAAPSAAKPAPDVKPSLDAKPDETKPAGARAMAVAVDQPAPAASPVAAPTAPSPSPSDQPKSADAAKPSDGVEPSQIVKIDDPTKVTDPAKAAIPGQGDANTPASMSPPTASAPAAASTGATNAAAATAPPQSAPSNDATTAPPGTASQEVTPASSAGTAPSSGTPGATQASTAPAAAATTNPPVAPAVPPPFSLDVASALQRAEGVHKDDGEGLLAAYAAREGRPIWFTKDGPNAEARKLVAEIRKAGDWGLTAAFDTPSLGGADITGAAADRQRQADAEVRLSLVTLKYARHARGGRFTPTAISSFLDRKPAVYAPASVLEQIARAAEPGEYLRNLHPKHEQFRRLLKKYQAARGGRSEVTTSTSTAVVTVPDGPLIEPGSTHPHVGIVRQILMKGAAGGVPAGQREVYDDELVEAVKRFQASHDLTPPGLIGRGTRAALNGGNAATASSGGTSAQRLLANLEQWRWMPSELGNFYVWVNVPEFLIRVVQNGEVIHTERVVVGKLDTQTPIFSGAMQQVIFHPFWGVPNSIKTNEILPSLRRGGSVLAKHNLRIQSGGKDINVKSIDWTKTDIRQFHVYQPPGGDNVLGVVKFRFPNKHDVYMHDTPSKSLFNSKVRAFSHGCMRVQDPVKLAEILLSKDKRMSGDRVRAMSVKGAQENRHIGLSNSIPVHVTYFTSSIDDRGREVTYADLYGHEERIRLALAGKMHLIKPVPEPKVKEHAEPVGQLSEINTDRASWAQRAFSGGN